MATEVERIRQAAHLLVDGAAVDEEEDTGPLLEALQKLRDAGLVDDASVPLAKAAVFLLGIVTGITPESAARLGPAMPLVMHQKVDDMFLPGGEQPTWGSRN